MKKTQAPAAALRTEANVPLEISFTAGKAHGDPFNEVALDVLFIDPEGRELRVPAFWAGARTWKVRYASPLTGRHSFRSESTPANDAGLHGIAGAVEISPYTGSNPLYAHGPLQVAPSRRTLEHRDGTPFFWLGDTWWMGLCHRLEWPDGFRRLAADRTEKGFSVIQIVAGLYPDMPAFDPRGANEQGFPWEPDYARIRPEYFDAADERLRYLVEQGLTPCLVGAWGYFIPWTGVEKMKQHWRYLIARYGAWPMVWCVAGEANLPWYLVKNFPFDDRGQVRDWTAVMRYVRETDPFHRPITIHPTGLSPCTARHATEDVGLLDFDMLQTPHAQNEGVEVTIKGIRDSYAASPTMPVLDGEPCYDMLGDNITSEWPRRAFWSCMMNGAAGHTYGANGIWQCNQPNQPHGNSPWGGGYGKLTWEEAMHLPGSRGVAIGKRLLEQYAWPRFRPHPEWVAFTHHKWVSLKDCDWIWSDAAKPADDAPNARRYFRRTFSLAEGRGIAHARLRFAGNSHVEARINGAPAGVAWNHLYGGQFDDRARLLRPGKNVLTIWAEHRPPAKQPTGILACLEIHFSDGETLRIETDGSWKRANEEIPGWLETDFDDQAWTQATVLGRQGDAPWGEVGEPNAEWFAPQAAGIPGEIRVIYVPESSPVVVRQLGARARYRAAYFDPVEGARKEIGIIGANPEGDWHCPPPAGSDHDWVILLEPDSK